MKAQCNCIYFVPCEKNYHFLDYEAQQVFYLLYTSCQLWLELKPLHLHLDPREQYCGKAEDRAGEDGQALHCQRRDTGDMQIFKLFSVVIEGLISIN